MYKINISEALKVFPFTNFYFWKDNAYYKIKNNSDTEIYNGRVGFIKLKDVLVLSDGFITRKIGFTIKGNCNHNAFYKYNSDFYKNHYSSIKNGIEITTFFSAAIFYSIIKRLSKFTPFYFNQSLLNRNILILPVSPKSLHPTPSILKLIYNNENSINNLPVFVKNLIIPVPGTCGYGMQENIIKMNIAITQRLEKSADLSSLKILVLKRGRNRKIENFNDTFETIASVFKKHLLLEYDDKKEYNYKELLLMFYESSIIIGVHGAGFSNIFACRKGTKILEITTSRINGCFEGLSKQLELKFYRYIYDKSITNTYKVSTLNINTTDFNSYLINTFIITQQ